MRCLNRTILDNVLAGINERKTAGNSFVRKLGALFSDYEEIISNRLTVQGGNLAKMAEKLFGDYGTKMKANEYGFASEKISRIIK